MGLEDSPPRINLCCLPTPIHRLDRLTDKLRTEIWIKRDDLTGFALGGNKGRKLEYLIPDALKCGANAIVTCGALQSNFVRQLGAACSMFGIECHACVMSLPFEGDPPSGEGLSQDSGNVLLDKVFNVKLYKYPDGTWDELYSLTDNLAHDLEKAGKTVYKVPIGGSSTLGAHSFVLAAREAMAQIPTGFDYVVSPSSSGSTQVGLHMGFAGQSKVVGIAADPEPDLVQDFADLSRKVAEQDQELKAVEVHEFDLRLGYVGKGYSVLDDKTLSVIQMVAREEGLLLDPVYSGKAMVGLLDLISKKELEGRILFWHTGGIPTVFSIQGWQ